MATESIRVTGVVPASPERVYAAWMSPHEHGAMTGGKATIDATVGGAFTTWDGYIWGRTLELEPPNRLVQTWRTTDFPPEATESLLEVLFEPTTSGTRVTFVHTEIPEGQGSRYRAGWKSFYLEPMAAYFQQNARPTQVIDSRTLEALRSDAAPRSRRGRTAAKKPGRAGAAGKKATTRPAKAGKKASTTKTAAKATKASRTTKAAEKATKASRTTKAAEKATKASRTTRVPPEPTNASRTTKVPPRPKKASARPRTGTASGSRARRRGRA